MKNLWLGLFLLSVSTAQAASTHVLLEYDLGNQITRSKLMILSNGLVMKAESRFGKYAYLEDTQLSPETLSALVANIELASSAETFRDDKVPSALGGSFGALQVHSADGYNSVIYTLVPGEHFSNKTLVCKNGAAADAIRELVQSMVRDEMPLEAFPCGTR